ncbi:MAG: GNAT family N-acetyltransferase [Ignavibacteria bacterium]|nr:GNAT family N-acetyltransferase [Ignavibacteria bacterium]
MPISIKKAEKQGIHIFSDWAREEGWNPGIRDLDAFYPTDPDGFFLCFNGDEPVGCISAVKYSEKFGFIGFFIVKPAYRNFGNIAYLLGSHAITHLGSCNIGIDGVLELVENYKRLEFKYSHKNIRFEGLFDYKDLHKISANISTFSKKDFKSILRYDRTCFPAKRTAFLKKWLSLGTDGQYLYKNNSGEIEGIAAIRQCFNGHKIGPLFANSYEIAEELFLSLKSGRKGPIYLDVPETNENALKLAENYKMKQTFATARMYNKRIPNLKNERIYGTTTFELG